MPSDNFPASVTFRRVRGDRAPKSGLYIPLCDDGVYGPTVTYRKGELFRWSDTRYYGPVDELKPRRKRNAKA